MRLGVQLSLLLLLSLSAPVPATSLAGSCVEAGFTECCDLEQGEPCFAPPTYCLCDPSCHEHGDCCDDIGEICYPQPAQPVLLLSVNVTFHTTGLLWGVPADASPNDTYTIVYWDHNYPNTTLTHRISTERGVSEQSVKATIAGLEACRLYVWLVEASNGRAVSQSITSNFTTLCYSYPQPAQPVLLLSVNVTFHTTGLLWGIPADPSPNDTYTIVYWDHNYPNTTLTQRISTEHGVSEQSVMATIAGLEACRLYVWLVEASNGRAVSQSITSTFTTLCYTKIDELRVELYNSSAVLLSWQPPQLPSGVQLHEYMIHYTWNDGSDETGSIAVRKNLAVIADLSSDTFYHFWVKAVLLDGTLQTADSPSTSNVTIFVPDSRLIQLRGGPFKPCISWTQETEVQALHTFRHFIHQAISVSILVGAGSEWRDEELIEEDSVICDDSSSGREFQAVYRATVHSTPNHSIQSIISLVEEQVATGEMTELQVDTACPVGLGRSSEPLCGGEKPATPDCPKSDPTGQPQTHSLSAGNCTLCDSERETSAVTLPVLVTALVAELFLIVFLGMLVTAIVLLVRRRRSLAGSEKRPQDSTADPNTYS